MTITIDLKFEARTAKAEAEGLTVSAYVERLVSADQEAEDELRRSLLKRLTPEITIARRTGHVK